MSRNLPGLFNEAHMTPNEALEASTSRKRAERPGKRLVVMIDEDLYEALRAKAFELDSSGSYVANTLLRFCLLPDSEVAP